MYQSQQHVQAFLDEVLKTAAKELKIPNWDTMNVTQLKPAIVAKKPQVQPELDIFFTAYHAWADFQFANATAIEEKTLSAEDGQKNIALIIERDKTRDAFVEALRK